MLTETPDSTPIAARKPTLSRRTALHLLAGAAASTTLPTPAQRTAAPTRITPADHAFLDDLQRRATLFFLEQTDPATGQILDRAYAINTDGTLHTRRPLASIAATGFGLATLCIADHRRYAPHEKIVARIRTTLDYHLNNLQHDHGFLYHFNNVHTGEPAPRSEVSSIDTALLLCGVLTARAYFHHDPAIVRAATKLYERVEWPWMLNGGNTFSMGVRGGQFINSRWDHYCELMMIYLLAIGSPTHPVPPALWQNFTRPHVQYFGFDYISSRDPLFTHQYSHAYYDFRNKRDKFANYFQNSILATRAHKAFCLSLNMGYDDDYWGVSASDTPRGYRAWGGPPQLGVLDGSVVPCATGGSLPFLPADCLRVLRSLRDKYGDRAYGRYGFCDAFHPAANWYDEDVLGIDLGITALMAENLRSGYIWSTFMKNPEAPRALRLSGFHPA